MVISEEEAVLKESEISTKLSVSGVNVLLGRESYVNTQLGFPQVICVRLKSKATSLKERAKCFKILLGRGNRLDKL